MNDRERLRAVMNDETCDRLPVVHFGFWRKALEKWAEQGFIPEEWAREWRDGTLIDSLLAEKLGFDFNWNNCFCLKTSLMPEFEEDIIEKYPDGSYKTLSHEGVVVIKNPEYVTIPRELDHSLKGRKEWEELYLPKLQFLSGLILVPSGAKQGTEFEVSMTVPPESKTVGVNVGDLGQVISTLRPTGKAKFGDCIVDVVAEAEFLDKGTKVEIMEIHGNRVVVKAVENRS